MKPSDAKYWFWIKLSFLFFWSNAIIQILFTSKDANLPIGIYLYIQYDFLFHGFLRYSLFLTIVLLIVFYIIEKWMVYTTFLMTLISILFITHQESEGIFYRSTSYSTILGAQFLAYFIHRLKPAFNLNYYRIQFPLQIIVATYTLAGISKLKLSGLDWIDSGKYFSLQVLKNQYFFYYDTGSEVFRTTAWTKAEWFLKNLLSIKLLLTFSLFLELFCFLALIGKKSRISIGILLLLMHIGIYYVMGILIGGIAWNMVIFLLNPLYYFSIAFYYFRIKFIN